MNGFDEYGTAGEPFDFGQSTQSQWTPTAGQDQAAEAALRERMEEEAAGRIDPRQDRDRDAIYSIQLLVAKEVPWGGVEGIEVIGLPDLCQDRDEAIAACEAALATYQSLRPEAEVSPAWSRHLLPPKGEQAPRAADRSWRTSWTVHEL